MTERSPDERLTAHAAAIRDLRKRTEALERLLEGLDLPRAVLDLDRQGASPPSPVQMPTFGTFIPNPLCAMCGTNKEPGRTALTCKTCAVERTIIIKEGHDRASITRTSCFCCGTAFKAQTRFLCATCGKGHKMWVAANR